MLTAKPTEKFLLPELRSYLQEALGVDVEIRPSAIVDKLPYFLQDGFDLNQLWLRDRQILLASPRKRPLQPLSTLRTQLDKLASIAGQPAVLVVGALASYERKRLVQQRISFVVPGNQMYLPDLGIDFREYFRQPTPDVNAFSPATQALLLAALLHKNSQIEWQPAQVVQALDYTAMTLSRAVRELIASGLVTSNQKGKVRWLHMKFSPTETWENAKPYLRNPVKRVEWIHDAKNARLKQLPLAGLSALAHLTMLGDPPRPIYAVSASQWKAAQQAGVVSTIEQQADSVQWEVWAYTPTLLKDSVTVDPLSLTLSLQDNADERVQQALTELRGQFPW